MIKILSSKVIIAAVFMLFAGIAHAMDLQTIETDGLQILIHPTADWFKFKAVVGKDIIRDFVTPRPEGSTFKEKCLVFPKGTIDVKKQPSFLYDKKGNLLTKETSIGIWKCAGKALVETSIAQPPAIGTCFEESTWNFIFKSDKSSGIMAHGFHTVINTLQPGKKLVKNELTITEDTEDKELIGKKVHGRAYVAPDGQSFVIEVSFDEKITIQLK